MGKLLYSLGTCMHALLLCVLMRGALLGALFGPLPCWGVAEVLQGVSLFSRTSRLPLRVRGWRCACARGSEPRRISILEIGELSRWS